MKYLLILGSVIALPSFAAGGGDLDASDYTGVSFWLVTAALLASTVFFFIERDRVAAKLASTVFFFIERDRVAAKWKTSLTVSGLVTGIAFWHYLYMRGVWVETGESPTVFRYIDWLLTVPLLICEFYLILAAATNVAGSLFKKLLIGSLVMLVFGYMGEAGIMAAWPAFIVGCLAWVYMIYELWAGEGKSACNTASPAVQSAYNTMMYIII
ncbi:MAG: biphenyl 2,3-dioxygenase, partial [Proteobacteria bacterium]|nr:biphenyl 2,3-dioxygenase [Pseudomonadota bacterium]